MNNYQQCLVCGDVYSLIYHKNKIYCSEGCKRAAAKERKRTKPFRDNYQGDVYEPITQALLDRKETKYQSI